MTSPNIDRYSKFFYSFTGTPLSKIRSELIIEDNTSETRYYVALYNINERFLNVAHKLAKLLQNLAGLRCTLSSLQNI